MVASDIQGSYLLLSLSPSLVLVRRQQCGVKHPTGAHTTEPHLTLKQEGTNEATRQMHYLYQEWQKTMTHSTDPQDRMCPLWWSHRHRP